MTRRIDDAVVREMTNAGMTAQQIADELGCLRRTVHRSRSRSGVAALSMPINPDAVARLTNRGWSATAIARELGCTERSVVRVRRRLGIARERVPRISAENLAIAKAMIDDGAPIAEAARTIGCSDTTLHVHFPGRSWTHAQSGRHRAELRRARRLAAARGIDL